MHLLAQWMRLEVMVQVLKVFPTVRSGSGDVRHDPVHAFVFHLFSLLVTRVFRKKDSLSETPYVPL